MRLLQRGEDGEITLTEQFDPDDIPHYAILSHTWGLARDEVTFKDLCNNTGRDKKGYDKIRFCVEQAEHDGLKFSWVDTCCIDKTDSVELQNAINSMFGWYGGSKRCYVYLSDVSTIDDDAAFRNSKWFTRGWTLQELIAPPSVEFFTSQRLRIGSKRDSDRELLIRDITNIPLAALRGDSLSKFGIRERVGWIRGRETKRAEDQAYCLFGILNVSLPVIYGESKEAAMGRLLKEANSVEGERRRGIGFKWNTRPKQLVPLVGFSAAAPALAESQGSLVAVWRGRNEGFWTFPWVNPSSLYWTRLTLKGGTDLNPGAPSIIHKNVESQERPGLAALADKLVAAWKGVNHNIFAWKGVNHNTLYFSTLLNDSEEWEPPRAIPNARSSTSPTLSRWEWKGSTLVYTIWKGSGPEVYLSWYDGRHWESPKRLQFILTDVSPGLTCYGEDLFVAWKAFGTDKFYWLRLDRYGDPLLAEPHEMCWDGESNLGPALAEIEGTIYAAWKAKDSTDLWVATWSAEAERFTPAQTVPGPGCNTCLAPSLAKLGKLLMMAWLGDDSEKFMWWTFGRYKENAKAGEC